MRYIVIILIVFPFNKPSFGQNYDISEIFAGIKMFFTQNEIKSYIDKNEFYEMLPDNESKYYFVKFDSTEMAYAKYQLIDTIGKVFYTLNSEDFFLLGVNRWFEITNFHCSKNLMKFNFRTLSYRKLMNIKYINGYV